MLKRTLVAAALAVCATRASHAQNPLVTTLMGCTNGNPAFIAADPSGASRALDALLWRSAYANYVSMQGKVGALAAFDSIAARYTRLRALVGSQELAAANDSLVQRFTRARTELAAALDADGKFLKKGMTVASAEFTLAAANAPGALRLGTNMLVQVTDASRAAAVALCAAANTAANYLDYLSHEKLSKVADGYASTEKHWKLFIENGYSMTLWERLAASCRIPVIGVLVYPTRSCNRDPGRSLEPPRAQWIFVHPVAALSPLFRKDSVYKPSVVVELYGYRHHTYSDTKMTSFGVSFASSHAETGPSLLGGVVITPWGTAGVFGKKSSRTIYTVSADVLGWVPGIRQAAQTLRWSAVESAVSSIAEKPKSQ